MDHDSGNQADLCSGCRSHFPSGHVVAQVLEMGRMDPVDSMQYLSRRYVDIDHAFFFPCTRVAPQDF